MNHIPNFYVFHGQLTAVEHFFLIHCATFRINHSLLFIY